jgi:hypothetical protein
MIPFIEEIEEIKNQIVQQYNPYEIIVNYYKKQSKPI